MGTIDWHTVIVDCFIWAFIATLFTGAVMCFVQAFRHDKKAS